MTYFFRASMWIVLTFVAMAIFFVVAANIWVVSSTKDQICESVEGLPAKNVALVLGTSSKFGDGSPNLYFLERVQLAADLYKLGRLSHLILSGDNRTKYYNEPQEMRKALIRLGVPDSLITLDFAGLRTLDSIVRSKEIFGQHKILIVTQSFHCYRALFISRFYNVDAIALIGSSSKPPLSWRVNIREWFARAKAVADLYVFNTLPRHLGSPEPINKVGI